MPKKKWLCAAFPSKCFVSANLLSIEVLNMAFFETKQLDPRSI